MAKILVVEDEQFSAVIVGHIIRNAGHTVIPARDGKEAISKAKRERPDLIIMDLSLPAMTGWEATRRIKSDPATSGIPIVALTASLTAADRDEAYEAGCDAYETKPIDVERLLTHVTELVKS